MMWKCPPLNLFNWSNYWKWKNDMREPKEVDMTFTVTVTYKVTTYGNSRSECESKAENMSIEDIHKEGEVQDIEIGDGEQF
jgi:hypothetical protein